MDKKLRVGILEQQEWLDSVLSHCLKITLGSRL